MDFYLSPRAESLVGGGPQAPGDAEGHPQYSPDLSPNLFYLFPSVKNKLRGQWFSYRQEDVDAFKMQVLEIH
ncbi:hypothetical protein EVAR_4682_1 [Eumeta japonica]|uniref:Uncharacterized protein n=1 Tax=Eumeta variegata TaxID=151549 RepID=A0A4C1WPY7_EUMVA|nr:hypothetical protein EVAR_4682_1 [Eumeta japonica]